jgi:23S rRNA (uracil1939-C5)-methyltransferase
VSTLDCPKQARCPGCPLGAEPYASGLATKGQRLARALSDFRDLEPELLPLRAASPVLAYRTRAKLVSEGRALGLYERGSHRVIDISGCRVLSPQLARARDALCALLPLPIYGADLRETSEGALVTLLTEDANNRAALEAAARELVQQGVALSVAVSVRPEGNERVLAGEPEVVAGPAAARHQLDAGLPYGYAAHGGFVQAHAGQAAYVQHEIVRGLRERLGALDQLEILELFAGSGSLALLLSRAGARVSAVEAYAPAIALAGQAAREQDLKLDARAEDATRFVANQPDARYDAVIVNPPRRGLAPELRLALSRARPRALAYVSCNPHTLARDLWHLRQLGLAVEKLEPLDMIPWSDAVEALAWLKPASAPAPRVLYEDEHWLALDKTPHEPLPLQHGQMRVDAWDGALSGVSWAAKTAASATSLERALRAAEREVMVMTRGNLRKQGTVTRRDAGRTEPGARYRKQCALGRHSLARVLSNDPDEQGLLRDLASIGHPVLGDARFGDARSNLHLLHRYGLDRAFLHVACVRLTDASGRKLEVTSELAPDLAALLKSLGSD